ncbi:unnamed protein product [Thelazia callipaeda]|uniref:G_PROTEIN_RECEP_F1_2 domain-containing protein n=1 Tax=Thelazia callipaeda TaxID=103827 RepID=A0A0N5D9W7_THECL|nr:unnamed protein product [Thelazia callipaeda]
MYYTIMAFIIFHNGLTGLNDAALGITRLIDMITLPKNELIDSNLCLVHFSNSLVLLIVLNGFGLLANSVDRLLVILFPLQYFRHTQLIVGFLIAVVYIAVFIFMSSAIAIEIVLPARRISPLCLEQLVYNEDLYSVILCVRTLTAAASIPIMILVLVIMYKKRKMVLGRNKLTSFTDIDAFIQRQKSFTKTTLVSCSITFFLYVVPAVNQLIYDRLDASNENEMALYAILLSSINSYNLVMTFVYRQKDVRALVIKILSCFCCQKQQRLVISTGKPCEVTAKRACKSTNVQSLSNAIIQQLH